MKKLLLVLLIFQSFTSLVFAGIKEDFEKFYYSDILSSRHCGQNISHFMQFLDQQGNFREDIVVLSFSAPQHSWSFGLLPALNSRWGRTYDGYRRDNWSFHVIAVIDGLVYDFSYNDRPTLIPLKDYLHDMFIPNESFMINGDTFRVRGQGPYYTTEHALAELPYFRFRVLSPDHKGNFTEIERNLTTADIMQRLDFE
jgi:hypothetical protein